MKNNYLRLVAFMLAIIMIAVSFGGCRGDREEAKKPASSQDSSTNKDDSNTSSDTISDFSENSSGIDTNSTPSFNLDGFDWSDGPFNSDSGSGDEPLVFNISDMLDGDESTYWSPYKTETSTVEFSLEKAQTFNAISFKEHRNYVTDYIIEAKLSGEWVQIYRQDEMGTRTGILDKTFTAKDFRLTLTLSDERGGISEITFSEEKAKSIDFVNVGYYTASRLDRIRANSFSELKGLTDIILFDFGAWNKDGEFVWSSEYDEEYLKATIEEVHRELNGEPIRIWFSLQNYHKASTTDQVELFATEEVRQRLADYAVELCQKYDFYGIDIDYEYPQYSKIDPVLAWSNYDKFLKLAADTLHKAGYKFSAAMSPISVKLSKETVEAIDRVNIMAYDLIDSNGRHSSYARANMCVVYFTDLGFKPSQLILGLPFYTKTTTNEGGQAYYWIVNRWRGAIKPWVNSAYTNRYVFHFNGAYLIRDKVFYSINNNLGGVFCWCVGSDVPDTDSRSLSLSVEETIKRFTK